MQDVSFNHTTIWSSVMPVETPEDQVFALSWVQVQLHMAVMGPVHTSLVDGAGKRVTVAVRTGWVSKVYRKCAGATMVEKNESAWLLKEYLSTCN